MKKIVGILICILLIFTVFPASANILVDRIYDSTIFGNTLYVGGSGPGNYTRIQDAIGARVDGDTIYVYSGFYQEHLYINKEIVLKGENRNTTIIDGNGSGVDVVRMESSVDVSNFTIQNKGGSHYDEVYDGMILGCSNVSVKNMNFIGCGLSYDFDYNYDESFNNTVINNFVNGKPLTYLEDKTYEIVDYPCGQIILVNCKNITISNQNISNLRIGIILSHSHNCYLYKNQIMNACYGILVYFSDNNTISENILSSNYIGIIYQGSNRNIFMKNTIESNTEGIYDNLSPFIYGPSSNNIIKNNLIRNNNEGVWLYSSAFIYNNEFRSNNWGVSIFWKTPIEKNNFYFNKLDVWIFTSPSTYTKTIIDGNYWGRPRVLPKLNLGVINFGGYAANIPWFFIDWHPAKEPYDIP